MFNNSQIIFIDFSNLEIPENAVNLANELLTSAINKVELCFSETNIDFVLEKPEVGNFSTISLYDIKIDSGYYL